jgi:hypothetical protein
MISLKDKLSRLSYTQACKLLGPQGKQLILEGGKYEIDVFEQVNFNNEHFRLNLEEAQISIGLDPQKVQRLNIHCSVCPGACKHQGAAFAFIGEMFSAREESEDMARLAGAFKAKLSDCMQKADYGTLKMTISLPDEAFLDNMARSLAQMVSAGRK